MRNDDDRDPLREGWIERLMFRPLPLWITLLLLVLGLVAMVLFGALVRRNSLPGAPSGAIDRIALVVADTPRLLRGDLGRFNPALVTQAVPRLPDGLALNRHQPITDKGYALFARYSAPAGRFIVALTRLSDGAVVRRYAPDVSAVIKIARDHAPSRYRLGHPFLMEDGGLIFHSDMSPIVRIDACGRILWTINGLFHHSIERDVDGTFVTAGVPPKLQRAHVSPLYRDDRIVRFSPTGHVLSAVSVGDLLTANGLRGLWLSRPYTDDPFHLNDIQPVVRSGRFWRRGDLFLSLRSLSLVALYRPSTGRILWARSGPWSKQHDVNILDDHRISIFDNRALSGPPEGDGINDWVDGHNRLLVYDFATNRVSSPYERGFAAHAIRTVTEGRGTPLPGGDLFVEESNFGRVLRMGVDGTLRWRYVSADSEGQRYRLGWSRYLDPVVFRSSIEAAARAKCD